MSSSVRIAAAFLLAGVCLLAVLYVGPGLPNDGNGWNPFNLLHWSSTDTPKDSDGDGIPDNVDKYPYDHDNDGFNDSVDLVPDSDAGFALIISTVQLQDRINGLDSNANVYFTITVDGVSQSAIDNSGEGWNCRVSSPTTVNQTFYFNLADDVRYHTIELTMRGSSGNTLDIDGSSASGYTLKGTFDIVTGTWSGNDHNGVADGSLDGSSTGDAELTFEIAKCAYEAVKNFSWEFDNTQFSLQLTIPTSVYEAVKTNGVNREYHTDYDDVKTFVTPQDPIIQNLTSKLEDMAQEHGYSGESNVNFVLSFVQNIGYSTDQASEGVNEYWRFPVETLYDHTGDCEDTSFLFGSLMEAMGQDAAMIIFPNADHMGAGVAWSTNIEGTYFPSSDGTHYYYCETTHAGFTMGVLPDPSNTAPGSVNLQRQQAVVVPV